MADISKSCKETIAAPTPTPTPARRLSSLRAESALFITVAVGVSNEP